MGTIIGLYFISNILTTLLLYKYMDGAIDGLEYEYSREEKILLKMLTIVVSALVGTPLLVVNTIDKLRKRMKR